MSDLLRNSLESICSNQRQQIQELEAEVNRQKEEILEYKSFQNFHNPRVEELKAEIKRLEGVVSHQQKQFMRDRDEGCAFHIQEVKDLSATVEVMSAVLQDFVNVIAHNGGRMKSPFYDGERPTIFYIQDQALKALSIPLIQKTKDKLEAMERIINEALLVRDFEKRNIQYFWNSFDKFVLAYQELE